MKPVSCYQLGLVGWPLAHSLSPQIHQAALQALSLTGQYHLYPISPGEPAGEAIKKLILQLQRQELHGLNVTIPYKLEVLRYVDGLAPAAAAIGAANTLYVQQGRVLAENTDADGFLSALQAEFPERMAVGGGQSALILGGGGAARAAAYALLQNGWQVVIATRRVEAGLALVEQLQPVTTGPLRSIRLEAAALSASMPSPPALIVNATPAGMPPGIERSPWPPGVPFPPGAALFDMIYHPPETRLVAAARSAGLPACTGLRMLVEQAARAFELWTGCSFPRQAVWQQMSPGENHNDSSI